MKTTTFETLPPSILRTEPQYKHYGPKAIEGYGQGAAISATVRFDDESGNGHNTFAITATVRAPKPRGHRGYWDSDIAGGCMHKEIAKAFPELAPFLKWHLCSTDGPMHYFSDTLFLAGDRDCWGLRKGEFRQHTSRGQQNGGVAGVPNWKLHLPEARDVYANEKPAPISLEWQPYGQTGEGKEREPDAARRVAIWPDATEEQLMSEPEELKRLLLARLPDLMAEFKAAVESLGLTY